MLQIVSEEYIYGVDLLQLSNFEGNKVGKAGEGELGPGEIDRKPGIYNKAEAEEGRGTADECSQCTW